MRAALADPMLEDRHEVLVSYSQRTEDGQNADEAECPATGVSVRMAGLRRALVVESEIVGV